MQWHLCKRRASTHAKRPSQFISKTTYNLKRRSILHWDVRLSYVCSQSNPVLVAYKKAKPRNVHSKYRLRQRSELCQVIQSILIDEWVLTFKTFILLKILFQFSNRLGPMDQTPNRSDKISYVDDPNYFTTVSLPRQPKKKTREMVDGTLLLNAAKQSNTYIFAM